MRADEVIELIGRVVSVDSSCRDREVLKSALSDLRRLTSWASAREARLAGQLTQTVSFPERDHADATRGTQGGAARVIARQTTVEQAPAFAAAFDAGAIAGEHVDALARTLRSLEPEHRAPLIERQHALAAVATDSTVKEFERALAAEVRRLEADGGLSRLERQKRAARLRTWVDPEGMWNLAGRFDPEAGVALDARLRQTVERLFAEAVPECCPIDPLDRQQWLKAQALVALVNGDGPPLGRSDVVVVVDTTAPLPDGTPQIDWGLPVELPHHVLIDLFATARVWPVVVRSGAVVYAEGQLNLGRTTRLANRAQRRALRGLYATCAIEGCDVPFELCDIHHVIWWEHGGCTDLVDLIPACNRHHHLIHQHGWQLSLTPDRILTIRFPDGTTSRSRPVGRRVRPVPDVRVVEAAVIRQRGSGDVALPLLT
jgi:hypothetical protein